MRHHRPFADERGIALPMALFVLLILLGLSAAILATGTSETAISTNHVRSTQALYVAEAGLEDAFNTIRANGMPATATAWTAVPSLSGPGSNMTAFGTYTVEYMSAGTSTVVVRSIATSGIGSAQRILRSVLTTQFSAADAVRTKDTLEVTGSATISGGCGSVHSNGALENGGSQNTGGNATASGTYTPGGTVGGIAAGSLPTKPIPTISSASFLTAAKAAKPADEIFQLMADGRILNGAGVLIEGPLNGAPPTTSALTGWKYKTAGGLEWSFAGNVGQATGTFYVESNASISGTSGTWTATVIATGDITMSGNPQMAPHLQDTWLVADKDIDMTGAATGGGLSGSGLIAAHEQIEISGNSTINGYIIAEGAASTSNTVTANLVTGSAVINYNCGGNPPLFTVLTVLSWGY